MNRREFLGAVAGLAAGAAAAPLLDVLPAQQAALHSLAIPPNLTVGPGEFMQVLNGSWGTITVLGDGHCRLGRDVRVETVNLYPYGTIDWLDQSSIRHMVQAGQRGTTAPVAPGLTLIKSE